MRLYPLARRTRVLVAQEGQLRRQCLDVQLHLGYHTLEIRHLPKMPNQYSSSAAPDQNPRTCIEHSS